MEPMLWAARLRWQLENGMTLINTTGPPSPPLAELHQEGLLAQPTNSHLPKMERGREHKLEAKLFQGTEKTLQNNALRS